MGWAGSGPEFDVNFVSDRVGSLHLWVGLGRVKKVGPRSNAEYDSKNNRSHNYDVRLFLF